MTFSQGKTCKYAGPTKIYASWDFLWSAMNLCASEVDKLIVSSQGKFPFFWVTNNLNTFLIRESRLKTQDSICSSLVSQSPWPLPASPGLVTQKRPAVCVCSTTPRSVPQAKLPSLRFGQRCCSECAPPNMSGNGPFQLRRARWANLWSTASTEKSHPSYSSPFS